MARSLALLCIVAIFVYADAHDDVMDVVASMAGALTEQNGTGVALVHGNVSKFMAEFSKDMPDYDTMKNNVTALVNEGEISSSIQPLTEVGTDQAYKIDLDWLLEVRSLEQDGPLVRRREVVHLELRKEKKHWKVVALKPLDFFAPAKLGQ
ncbi:MAG: hypothetical protein ABSG13_18010 [Bryobacteraceae bacterium]|jgi:hypothetical protein